MRKITPIPIILMVVISIVLASGILFPDTASLPRSPSGSGTIGGVLKSFFAFDGTANNTNSLSGISASGYLQNRDCSGEPINTVWVGTDADGQGKCGNVAGLVAIGHFSELSGNVQIWRDGTPGYVPAVNGQDLYEGDLIQSDATGTGTIQFAEDDSLLRFWTGTDLELRYGDLDGQTVAEVLLNDGRLWGRILSSTGVNLGGGGMVTGVRGTSVDIQKTATGYAFNTVSSANNTNVFKRLTATSVLGRTVGGIYTGVPSTTDGASLSSHTMFGSGTRIFIPTGPAVTTVNKESQGSGVSYTDSWIRKNTISDIKYMSDLLAVAPAGVSATRLNIELDNTLVQGNSLVTKAMLLDSSIPAGDRAAAAELLDGETAGDNINNAKALNCKILGQTYFPAMPSNTSTEYCNGSWNTLWTTMNLTAGLDGYGSHGDVYTTSGVSTNIITNAGQYLQYDLTFGQLGDLAGKKIKIELTHPAGYYLSSAPDGTKFYLLDLGSSDYQKYYIRKNKTCSGSSTPSYNWLCTIVSGSHVQIGEATTQTIFTIDIPSATQLVIGAYHSTLFTNPIGTSINVISIKPN